MKRSFTIIAALIFVSSGFAQQTTIAKWTFPTGNPADTLPDQANPLNTNKFITTSGGTSAIAFKNGATTKAAQATGWNNGQDVKSWQVEINATGSGKIQVSSTQTAGGSNPGPKDFKLQYRIGSDGRWTGISGGAVTVGNDWATGVVDNLRLPDECDNQPSLCIRWLMTSNLDAAGAVLVTSGVAKIDDIFITGELITGIENPAGPNLSVKVYPNPCSEFLSVQSEHTLRKIEVYSITGGLAYVNISTGRSLTIDTGSFQPGRYVLVTHFADCATPAVTSIIIN